MVRGAVGVLRKMVLVSLILMGGIGGAFAGTQYTAESQFATLYARILQGVEEGAVSESNGIKARQINRALQQSMLDYDNRLDVLKQSSMADDARQRQKSINSLIKVSGQREGVILSHLQQLQRLGEPVGTGQVAPAVVSSRNDGIYEMHMDNGQNGKRTKITVESIPEDISTGEYD